MVPGICCAVAAFATSKIFNFVSHPSLNDKILVLTR
jgi:hypothetical protein